MTLDFVPIVRCFVALQRGVVLNAKDVTAGNGMVIDWSVPGGHELLTDADPLAVALSFVKRVGPDAAIKAASDKAPTHTCSSERDYWILQKGLLRHGPDLRS